MKQFQRLPTFMAFLCLAACVTINVYFPAAAAENAADKLIKEIYGIEQSEQDTEAAPEPADRETSQHYQTSDLLIALVNFIFPKAHAQQADINVSTPAINQIKSQMTARHKKLSAFYASGAVGMEGNGLIRIKDIKSVSLDKRNTVKKLVSDENRDRNALYTEIARANSHPEWESEIRSTFARRWIANAPSGWWYNTEGSWKQK